MGKTTYYQKVKRVEKLSREEQLDMFFDLINAFKIVQNPYESALLLQDLLTATEIKHLGKRLRIAKLLLAGATHREIASKLNCSLATVTKVNMWLNQGGEGLKNVISKLPKRYSKPSKLPPGPIEFHLPQALLAFAELSLQKSQTKQLESFTKAIDNKRVLDKSLQKAFDEEFRASKHEQKRKQTKNL